MNFFLSRHQPPVCAYMRIFPWIIRSPSLRGHTAATVAAHRDRYSVVGIHLPTLPNSIDIQERTRRFRGQERAWVARSRLLLLLSVLVSSGCSASVPNDGSRRSAHDSAPSSIFCPFPNVSRKPSLPVFELGPVGMQQPSMSLCRWSQEAEREAINNRSV